MGNDCLKEKIKALGSDEHILQIEKGDAWLVQPKRYYKTH